MRTAAPRPYIAFYPGLYDQNNLHEAANILSPDSSIERSILAKLPTNYYHLERRINFDAEEYHLKNKNGPTKSVRLGDIALGRSGDKGSYPFIPKKTPPFRTPLGMMLWTWGFGEELTQ